LTVLIDTLDRLPKAIKGRKPLNRKLAKRAGALQKRAFARGRVVFDPKPAAWTKKLADRLSLK
jgi:ribosomal protein L4